MPMSDRGEPSVPSVSDVDAAEVRRLIDAGECLAAYDLAMSMTSPPDDVVAAGRLGYLRALSLARAGATRRAEAQLAGVVIDDAWAPVDLAEDVEALRARLAKDRALALVGVDRRRALAEAAARYEAVAGRFGRAYPAVNASTLWLLAGETERAHVVARGALGLVSATSESYWDRATRAEAELVLGRIGAARRLIDEAAGTEAGAGDRASTVRQLRLVCDHLGIEADELLAPIMNPDVLHFCGHLSWPDEAAADDDQRVATEVEQWLAFRHVGDAYGSLACGADIRVAEVLLRRGVRLHVVLPFAAQEFVEVSVRSGGPPWVDRFVQCLEAASSVEVTCDSRYFGDDGLFAYASDIAMGHAITHAQRLESNALQLAIWDGSLGDGLAGTGRDVATWSSTGRSTFVIEVPPRSAVGRSNPRQLRRRVAVALFGDFAGFSRLYDDQYVLFHDHVMGAVAHALAPYGAHLEQVRTWGDGLHFVLSDVAVAADLALTVQEALAEVDLEALGLPDDLRLRLSAHAGPVVDVVDPVMGAPSVSGRSLTRAARIEPRTPPGQVYVSGAFASLLSLRSNSGALVEYVGAVPTDKGFETLPMFVLRRR